MARVELRPSGGHKYAVVVEDVQDQHGNWKKKVIRSFGNASEPGNVEKAKKFAAAVNAGKSFVQADWEANRKDILQALTIMVGATLAAAAVSWLFGEE